LRNAQANQAKSEEKENFQQPASFTVKSIKNKGAH
jgi:hypothetical protein